MKPRRILIFCLFYYPHQIGGAEVAVKEITDRISPNEIEFDMVTLGGAGKLDEQIGRVNVHRVFRSSGFLQKVFFPVGALFKAQKLLRQNKYETIWSIMASYAGFASLLLKWRNPKVPFILTIQEGEHFGRREGILKPFFKNIFRHADRIQVISNYLAEWSRKMGARSPIDVVPNGVDFESFSKSPDIESARSLKEHLGKREGDIFLITTGRLEEKNAVDDIIKSLAHLPAHVKLLILGSGSDEMELKKLSANLKLSDRVHFLGFVPHSDLPAYLHVSDIFIRPSLSEGFGNSFIEAMAAGIPVIATQVGGIVDFLRDGETGLFCEVRNPKSIVQKVEKLMKDPESRNYIIRNAKEMVREKYQWEKIAGEMKKVLAHKSP